MPTRILVVDDHPVVRLGIRRLIDAEPSLQICAESASPAAAIEAAKVCKPDLAVVDLSFDGISDLALIRNLREVVSDLQILVLSMHDEMLFAGRVLMAGARGYIMKQEAIDGLINAIHTVLSGHIYISEKMNRNSPHASGKHSATSWATPEDLTGRELQVFELIGRGNSTARIAEKLAVSIKTVETYRASIKGKLNLKNGAELVRFATIWIEQI